WATGTAGTAASPTRTSSATSTRPPSCGCSSTGSRMAEAAPVGPLARFGAVKAVALALLVALALIGWTAVRHVGEGWRIGDFGSFYTVGENAAAGRYDAIYDRERAAFRLTMREPAIRVAWTYPPPALFLVRPLAWFEGSTARRLWTIALALAAAAAAAIAARDARAALLALPFPSLQLALSQGQFSPLLALLLAPAVGFADRRPFLAGLALGGLVIKPHLLIGPGLVMLGAARWRVAA